jgi:hypothetical protein
MPIAWILTISLNPVSFLGEALRWNLSWAEMLFEAI